MQLLSAATFFGSCCCCCCATQHCACRFLLQSVYEDSVAAAAAIDIHLIPLSLPVVYVGSW